MLYMYTYICVCVCVCVPSLSLSLSVFIVNIAGDFFCLLLNDTCVYAFAEC